MRTLTPAYSNGDLRGQTQNGRVGASRSGYESSETRGINSGPARRIKTWQQQEIQIPGSSSQINLHNEEELLHFEQLQYFINLP